MEELLETCVGSNCLCSSPLPGIQLILFSVHLYQATSVFLRSDQQGAYVSILLVLDGDFHPLSFLADVFVGKYLVVHNRNRIVDAVFPGV